MPFIACFYDALCTCAHFILFDCALALDKIAGSCLSPPKATVWSVNLSLGVLFCRLDSSSLLSSDQKHQEKKKFTPPGFATSCADMIRSKEPGRITSTRMHKVYVLPYIVWPPLLFLNINSRLTSRNKRLEPTFYPGYILSAGILNTRLWLWSLPQILWVNRRWGQR